MTTAIKRRRGTTAQHATFTGLEGEITVDTTKDTVVVHDGLVAGGHPLAKEKDPTFTGTVTLTGGTANGVAYLNGSKVLTTGSALTFDGSTLLVNTSAGTQSKINVYTGSSAAAATLSFAQVGAIGWDTGITVTSGNYQIGISGGIVAYNINRNGAAIDYHSWYSTGSEQMRLTSTGLGIGTSSPSHRLDVNGLGRMRFSSGTGAGHWLDTAGNASRFFVGTDAVTEAWRIYDSVAAAQRMTLDSSGNLGLGVTPSAWNGSVKSFEQPAGSISSYSTTQLWLTQNAYLNPAGSAFVYKTSAAATQYYQSGGQHQWHTAPSGTAGNAISFTQAMTLDASGNLLVGTTSNSAVSSKLYVSGSNFMVSINGTNTTGEAVRFYSNGSTAGTISYTATTVAYNTSSDYRLKENIQPMQNALDVVAQLNPVRYTWKADGSDGQGFIAHELQAVVPNCVTGEKDAVDAEGNPVYQGIDTSFLVATLTKAIQEQQEQINQLTARVAQLEGN